MKKALALLLALCMLLTLCACADSGADSNTDSSEKEFEAAKALYDAGDYENAIEALQNVGHYTEIAEMIADAQKQLAAENYAFLFTTWKELAYSDSTLTFFEDGSCDAWGNSVQYTVEDGKVTVAGVKLDITQEDGIYRLSGGEIDYVREEDYDRFLAAHTVELTLDNYLDYYEWAEERSEQLDAYGNISHVYVNHQLRLKEDYENRYNYTVSKVEIGYICERVDCQGSNMQIDFETLEYTGGQSYTNTESNTGTFVGSPASYTDTYDILEDGYSIVSVYSEPEIVRVEGQLVIW